MTIDPFPSVFECLARNARKGKRVFNPTLAFDSSIHSEIGVPTDPWQLTATYIGTIESSDVFDDFST